MEFVIVKLRQFIADQINQLTKGEDVVKWIDYELETLIPQLESAEALSDQIDNLTETYREEKHRFSEQNDNLRNMIRKAEVLAETYTKREIQRKAAAVYNHPFNSFGIGIISKKLHRIRHKITQAREEVSRFTKYTRQATSHSATEDYAPQGGDLSVPSYLRGYIHYFVLFPPEFKVPARRLIALWVAEGLIRSKRRGNQSVEQIAQSYLDELIQLRLIRVKQNRSGKVKTCWIDKAKRNRMLEQIKEAAVAKKASFLQENDGKIRRLVDHNESGSKNASFININGETEISPSFRDVISFLSFYTQEGSKPGEDIGDFLRKCISGGCFTWLNVLDLEGVFRPKLPGKLGKLIALKYLGLRWTYLEQLPDSVDKLFNLQVLDVKHTYISVLPRSIWSMEFLRHLYLSEAYRTKFPNPPSKVTLDALQTLWGAFIDEDTHVKKGLDRALNIRKLGLSCRPRRSQTAKMADQWKAIEKWISSLENLESLRLKSQDENNHASDLPITSLEGMTS